MSADHASIDRAQSKLQKMARPAAPWIESLARIGYASRGFIYITIGALALMATRYPQGKVGGTDLALRFLAHHRFGWLVIILLTLGMVAFAIWCFARSILDPEHLGRDFRGLAKRLGFLFTGFVYCGLAAVMIQFLVRMARLAAPPQPHGSDEKATQEWTARLMSFPLGRLLVAGVGIGFLIFAVLQIPAAFKGETEDPLRVGPTGHRWIRILGRIGKVARGIAFAPIGLFLILAARHTDPREARGLGGALASLRHHPHAPWLMGVVAAGLIAFGLHELTLARFRWIKATR